MSDSLQNEPGTERSVNEPETAPRRRRKRWRVLSWTLFILFDIFVIVGIGLFLASTLLAGRDLPAPDWTAEEAGKVLSRGLGGARAEVGAITLRVSRTMSAPAGTVCSPGPAVRTVRTGAVPGLTATAPGCSLPVLPG